ncbi:MAG: hypothetical protein A2X59_01780 [Nitrospirae bacterium GWC2_42_7]|nr:MAG: hypothetical protein A2X59_01780 [Nitrospirae bacterium GWC2_42_7]
MNIQKKILLSFVLHVSILIVVFVVSNKSTIHKLPPDLTNVFFLEEKTSVNTAHSLNNKNLKRQEEIPPKSFSMGIETPARNNTPVSAAQTKDISVSKDIGLDEKAITTLPELKEKTQIQYAYFSSQEHNKTSVPNADPLEKTSASSKDLNNKEAGDTNFSGVLSKIRAAVEKAKNYPAIARKNGIEGSVLTEFSINSSGLPVNIKIIKSSGFNVLDSAAVQTITRAAPFPVIKGDLEIPITFVLEK